MHVVSNEGNFVSQQLCVCVAKQCFYSVQYSTLPKLLCFMEQKEHTHMLSLEALVVIVSRFCVCFFRQFYALDSPPGINPEKSNQTLFISTDSHFRFISSDRGQILYQSCTVMPLLPSHHQTLPLLRLHHNLIQCYQ